MRLKLIGLPAFCQCFVLFLLAAVIFLSAFHFTAPAACAGVNYVIPVRGTVEYAMLSFIKRGLAEADKAGASLIIIDIDTFGGRVDAAIEISKLLRELKKPVVAYVSENAWSAGALIALSTPNIYMCKGSSIGSAEPKNMSDWSTDEKMVSALRAQFESVASAMKHPEDLAKGMVDKDVEIKDIKPKGKLLNLTFEQALKYKLSEASVSSIDEVLALEHAVGSYITHEQSLGEGVARFVSDPIVSGILLNLGILGLTVEFWMPGHIAPGLGGIICFALFFWGHTIANAGSMLPLLLFIIGISLIMMEVFVIPGFGLTGLLGIGLTFGGVYLAFPDPHEAVKVVSVSIILTTIIIGIFITYFPTSKMFKQVTLSASITGGSGAKMENIKFLGKTGVAVTDLNPAGRAKIDGETVQVVSDGQFVAKGVEIKVISDEGNVITVTIV
jgi:membrane-bound serine protease (ClpP class)